MGRSTGKVREIAESGSDAKAILNKALGAVSEEIFHNQVLVATYIRPAQTKGGIFLADQTLQEDVYQGTVFMVVAKGPSAFKDDNIAQFHGMDVKVGDWVLARPSDGLALEINQVPCRLFEDTRILMRVKDPSRYW